MLHTDIWRGLDLLAAKHGLTSSALARQAGLDATAFNKSKRQAKDGRPRWPSTESISRALLAVEMNFVEFAELVADRQERAIPCLRRDELGKMDAFREDGRPIAELWRKARFPGMPANGDHYAIEMTDHDFAPIYRPGDRVIVSPSADINSGARVILMSRAGELLIADLISSSKRHIEIDLLADERSQMQIDLQNMAWIARILWVSQ